MRPPGASERLTKISKSEPGDDSDAKSLVSGLLVDLGWSVEQQIDLGGIETARGPEHYFLLFAALMQTLRSSQWNIAVQRGSD
jgi:hypothetical protein